MNLRLYLQAEVYFFIYLIAVQYRAKKYKSQQCNRITSFLAYSINPLNTARDSTQIVGCSSRTSTSSHVVTPVFT